MPAYETDEEIRDVLTQIKRELAMEGQLPDADIYTADGLDIEFDDDAITPTEHAFMQGWHSAN